MKANNRRAQKEEARKRGEKKRVTYLTLPDQAAEKRKEKKQIAYMTVPEKDRFFKVISDIRDRALFRLLYHHGLRAGEIGKLDMSDFRQGSALHLDRIFIHRLKGSISGETAMVPIAAQALRAWVRKRGHAEGPLFPSRHRSPITRCRIWQLMQRYSKAAGIPPEKSHPHCLKHTCGTHLVSDQRESIMDVQKHLGHASIKNTMIYAELTGEANESRIKRLREWR
jgi:integrase/recombinase XerD